MLRLKQQELYDLLYSLDFDESREPMPNQQELGIEGIIDKAEEDSCIDEVKEIVLKNKDKELMDVISIIWHSDLFTPLEITDDDEDEEIDE